MFDSPLHYCTRCHIYVELDQGQIECARQHGCIGDRCPLKAYFCGPSNSVVGAGREPPSAIPLKPDLD